MAIRMTVLQPDWYVNAEQMAKLKAEGYKGVLYFFDELPQSVLNMNIFAQIADSIELASTF